MDTFGYARVSSNDQNLDRQLQQLNEYGCHKVYKEKQSGKNIDDRKEFQSLLNILRDGDELVVISLDRLSRNYDDIQAIVKQLRDKGVKLTVLDMPYLSSNTNNPALDKMLQDLFLSVMAFVSENERQKIRERQRQGIEIAKAKGIYKGRQTEYSNNSKDPQKKYIYESIIKDLKAGKPKMRIAKKYGVSRTTIYKIYNQLEED